MANYGVKGTVLQVTIGTTYTAVGQIQSLNAPGMKTGVRDVTHLLSSVKECEATIGDPQEFSGTLLADFSDQGAVYMQTLTTTPSTIAGGQSFRIIFPTTTKFFGFQAIVTDFTPTGGDVEGTWLATFALKPSRAITYPTT
jgi:hypothetical protein